MPTHENTINVALGEVLADLRPHSWRVQSEETRTIRGASKRPDVLIEEASQWPVAIEADKENHASAEDDARARLGQIVNETRKPIESAIALVYPPEVADLDGRQLRDALGAASTLQYALLTRTSGGGVERLPQSGWLTGSVRDLAMLAHRASIPAPRVDRMGKILEHSIEEAAAAFTARHDSHLPGSMGADIAALLGQSDDQAGQTRRMAMTVVINALVFHEALAEAEFFITDGNHKRRLRHLRQLLQPGDFDIDALITEWQAILEINYWPIFATASEIIRKLPQQTAVAVLTPLRRGALRMIQRGVTKSHDLTGVIFQRLIADRKFLATFYTRPAAAALLAGLAIPADRAPGGAEWGDEETIAALQIGDFACGTGTLLSAAYQRIGLLHELNGGDPRKLHAPMMKHGLVGLDVLNIAVHLTAATLAGAHPDVPFDGECLLTMPYGGESASIGSLELLAEHVSPNMIDNAAAISAGGRRPENVRDLVSRVGHRQFDLVIMNPPFTRHGGQEGKKKGTGNPAFAAFNTTKATQKEMTKKLRAVRGGSPLAGGNAGPAADFLDLGLRKLNSGGTLALVLPLSALSGVDWDSVRQRVDANFSEVTVVTVADAGSFERSFSEDTGMADCLIVAKGYRQTDHKERHRARFVCLASKPVSAFAGQTLSSVINSLESENIGKLDFGLQGGTRIQLGNEYAGEILDSPLPDGGGWPVVGISDLGLAQCAYQLTTGNLYSFGKPADPPLSVPVATISDIADRGPYHMDIYYNKANGDPQGPFNLIRPMTTDVPVYPMLWAHDAKRERQLIVSPDTEGVIKDWPRDQVRIDEAAANVWASATWAHYNRDLQFNSQSLIVAMTERKCIGGHAWPSVILHNSNHEYTFSLWCNSTLGLLMHWWVTNKTQAGRGRTTVTGIPNIPTLDTRALTKEQHAEAKRQFELLQQERFLPFDQIDEDPARAKLDQAILIDVLGLPKSLVTPDGPIDLIRRKLAREPQIHGGKKSRVVFTEDGEKTEKRSDR